MTEYATKQHTPTGPPLVVIGVHQGEHYIGYACIEAETWDAMGPDERRAWMREKFPEVYE